MKERSEFIPICGPYDSILKNKQNPNSSTLRSDNHFQQLRGYKNNKNK